MANVLIVDDDPVAIQVLKDTLVTLGHEIYDASDWSSMNDQLFQRHYALAILDVNLPGLKGDALARIVARAIDPKPKVLFYSGLPKNELRRLARKAGAIGFIVKGSSEQETLQTVEAAIRAYAEESGTFIPPAAARTSLPPTLEEYVSEPPQARWTGQLAEEEQPIARPRSPFEPAPESPSKSKPSIRRELGLPPKLKI